MLLTQVIRHIQNEADKLYSEKNSLPSAKLSASRAELLAVLEKVILLLEQSNDGSRIEKIKQALYCLQNVKVAVPSQSWLGYFTSQEIITAGEILKKQYLILPTDQSKTNLQNTSIVKDESALSVMCRGMFSESSTPIVSVANSPLSIHEYETLGAIHIALMKCYSRIKWCFVYPSETAEDINEIIQHWQTKRIQLSDSAQAAHPDYKRTTCIMREVCRNNKEIDAQLNALIQRAYGYAKNRGDLLKEWLASNGGQDNSRFITALFEKGYFVQGIYNDLSPTIGLAEEITAPNWFVDKGKICFKFDMAIRTIQYGSLAVILTNKLGETKLLTSTFEIGDALEEVKTPPTLLRVAGKIMLDICDGVVMPKIKSFTVLSFTDFIKHPTKNNNQELQIAPPIQNNIIRM